MKTLSPDVKIRASTFKDQQSIFGLYAAVASVGGGLARLESEISSDYVADFLEKSIVSGVSVVAEIQGQLVGEIHTHSSGLYCFAHVLSELTIAVHPDFQGSGIGRMLFGALMEKVETAMPEIRRVELIVRESNQKAIAFYKSLGFSIEGDFENRIRNVDGSFESDVPMAWARPAVSGR